MSKLALMTLILLISSLVFAETWEVDLNGGGDFLFIQDAIDHAVGGDEILVHAGTYAENIDFLGKDIWVHSQDGPENTIIDGGSAAGDERSCVYFWSGETAGAILEGFTLINGQGTWFYSMELEREWYLGGAVFCILSSPTIQECRFLGNSADYAAAIYVEDCNPSVISCQFRGNTAQSYGGAIAGPNGYPLTITGCLFEDNFAGDGDGTIHLNSGSVIEDCRFLNNEARAGAGINSPNYGADFEIRRCIFEGNHAHGTHGGAIRVHEASPTIEDCHFAGNSADVDGGAILLIDGGQAFVENCTFHGNSAARNGGHVAVWGATPTFSSCIFSEAVANGGVFCENGAAHFLCIDSWNNVGGNYTGICPDPTGEDGNISVDPLFCNPDEGDFTLREDSPCAAENNTECGLIGAYGIGCLGPTPTTTITWGRLKLR